jgi:hypothetical protein
VRKSLIFAHLPDCSPPGGAICCPPLTGVVAAAACQPTAAAPAPAVVLSPSCCAPRRALAPAAVRAPSCCDLRRVPARFLHRWRHETDIKLFCRSSTNVCCLRETQQENCVRKTEEMCKTLHANHFLLLIMMKSSMLALYICHLILQYKKLKEREGKGNWFVLVRCFLSP